MEAHLINLIDYLPSDFFIGLERKGETITLGIERNDRNKSEKNCILNHY